MKIYEQSHFKLIDKRIPVIEDNEVIIDSHVGGIKLTYLEERFNIYEFFGKIRIESLFPKHRIKHVYLKPYKSQWDTSRRRLPKNYWGKKDYPLTNLWLELAEDYDRLSDVPIIMIDHQVYDNKLIRYLNKTTKHFIINTKK